MYVCVHSSVQLDKSRVEKEFTYDLSPWDSIFGFGRIKVVQVRLGDIAAWAPAWR